MNLPFTFFTLTSQTRRRPVANKSPKRQHAGGLASGFRAVGILLWMGLASLPFPARAQSFTTAQVEAGPDCNWPFNSVATNPADGKTYGFWRKGSGATATYKLIRFDGSSWTTVGAFGAAGIASDFSASDDVSLAIDATGKFHVVFQGEIGGNVCCNSTRGVWYGSSTNGSSWTFSQVQTFSHPSGWRNTDNPVIQLDASNQPHVVFLYSDAENPRLYTLRYYRYSGGAWTGQDAFSQTGGATFNNEINGFDFSLDGAGKAHIAFQRETDGSGRDGSLWYVTNGSGSWTAPVELAHGTEGQAQGLTIAMDIDAANKVHIVHSDYQDQLNYVTNTSGAFTSNQLNGNLTGGVRPQNFKINSNGDRFLVYSGDQYAYLLAGKSGNWTTGTYFTQPVGAQAGAFYSGLLTSEGRIVVLFDNLPSGSCSADNPRNLWYATATLPAAASVATLSPSRNAITADKTTNVAVTLNKAWASGEAASEAVTVWSGQAGGKKAGTATVSGNALTFNPTADFKPGETVFTTTTTASGLAKAQVYQFTTAAAPALGTFSGGSEIAVGTSPSSVAAADVDGDGDLDLLAANYDNTNVSVRLNDGSGTFSGGSNLGVGSAPISVAVGDVDGDGDLDILTANAGSANVSVRLNDGSGTFSGGSNVGVGSQPRSVAVGDVDGDGDLDLLAANFGNANVSVRLNDGSGTFSGGSNVGVGSQPQSVALGDVDGDGDLDLLAANFGNANVSVRLNDGSGIFSGTTNVAVGSAPVSIALGDVDGDGDLDFLAANEGSGNVSVRLNDGSGTFSGGSNLGVGSNPQSVALGDVDGDGDLDLLAANAGSGNVSVRLNNGSGTFGGGSNVGVGSGPRTVALGDVDGDGDLDFLTANLSSDNVSVRLNRVPPAAVTALSPARNAKTAARATNVTVTLDQNWPSGTAASQAVTVWSGQAGGKKAGTATVSGNALTFNPTADFKPGETVFTTTTTASGLAKAHVHQFTTSAAPAPATFSGTTNVGVGLGPLSVAVGDVDGDGDLDFLAANNGSASVSVRLNDGSGTFSGTTNVGVGLGPSSVAVGDVDGDGDLDLLAANIGSASVSVRLNDGSGTFSGTTNVEVGNSPLSVAVGDVDGDGDLDFLAANFNSASVSVRLNDGSGTFSGTTNVGVGSFPTSVAVGDVDGDGDLDFLAANQNNNNVSVRLNDGSGNFSGTTNVGVGSQPQSVAVGDVDGDGDLDFLAANNAFENVSVRLNDGSGNFSGTTNVGVGNSPRSVATADVDGDGDLDLLTANNGSASVSVRLNDGSGTFSGTTNVAVGSFPRSVAVGDVDGDGDLDFLAANDNSNNVSVRLNQLILATINKTTELEDRTVVFTSADFANALSGGQLTKIKITTLPASATGVLRLSGTPVTLNQEIPRANISNLTFIPAANYNGAASFTWNGNVGDNYAASDASVNITLLPVNDAPNFILAASPAAVNEDAGAQTIPNFATALEDGDPEVTQILSLPVSNNTNPGLFAVAPAIDVNGTLTYTPAANAHGSAIITVSLTDNGGTANGGINKSADKTFTITVNPVNDAPVVANAISNVSVPEDTESTILDLSTTFSDADGQPLTVTVSGNTNLALVTASYDAGTKKLTLIYNPDKSGTATITVSATDGTTQIEDTFLVTVNNANDAPVADAQEVSAQEDTPQTITLTGADADEDALTYEIVTGPGKGTLSGMGAARTYTPNANANGTDSFTFRVNDGAGFSAPATVSITVTAVNDAPVATAQSVTTEEDVAKAIVLAGTDVDANTTLTYAVVTAPAHGTLSGTGAGRTYTPNANYHGTDSFTFTANDGSLTSAPATVTITVTPVNDAPVAVNDARTTNEDTQLTGTSVLANDTDADGNALTAILVTGPAHGTLVLNNNGSFMYTPAANYNGSDAFTYKVNDGTADGNIATVAITITAVNDAPVAVNDAATTDEDTPLAGTTVLANDTDMDGNPLTAILGSGPSHGTLKLNSNGTYTYTPAANYSGPDAFTYRANDGTASSNLATVTITVIAVNQAPVAAAQSVSTPEDVAKAITLTASDVDGDALTYAIVTEPAHGTLSGTGAARTYTPNANYHGPDSFTFTANDGRLTSAPATVTITVTPVNDAPVAVNDAFSTAEDMQLAGTSVLANDTDADGNALTAILVNGPTRGILAFNTNGSFTYTPAAHYNGPDAFTYKVNDGAADGNTATVSITVTAVNDAPVATDDGVETNENIPVAGNVLTNDTDVEGNNLTAVLAAGPAHGTLMLNSNGTYTYTPAANYSGPDAFTYRAADGTASSNLATVTITVIEVNQAPVATAQSVSTPEDVEKVITLTANDADGDALTYTIVTGPTRGTLTGTGQSRTYKPNANYHGADSFTFKANDGTTDGDVATVTITITAVNDAPVANSQSVSTQEDVAKAITLTASDVENNALTYTIVTGPVHGTLSGSGANRSYTPEANYSGPDSFTFQANDADASNVATVSITVTAVNDAPVATAGTFVTTEDTPGSGTVSARDVDDATLTYVAGTTAAQHGTVVLNSNGSYTYTPAANYNGADAFSFKAYDGSAYSAEATVTVTVTAVNDAPVLGALAVKLAGAASPVVGPILINSTIAASVLLADADFPNDRVTVQWNWDDGSIESSYSVTSAGNVTKSHTYVLPGVYTVRVEVTDQASATTSASYQYVVVYNPNGGFVTGAGWTNSPAGAYAADPGAFGKAHFGFVSRYQKGATVPTGNTDFEFKTAGMNFTSTVYEWLVVAGAKAQYKGVGTINGSGNYGFILSAIDGQATGGGGSDKVRIKIWDKNNGDAIVYDNQLGASDDASATTAIGGGAVVVHDGKSKARTNNTLQSEPAGEVAVYPNPVVDKVTIDLKGMAAAGATTVLTDAAGNLVSRPAPSVAGASLLELDMSGLRPGLYLIRLRTEAAYQVIKVIKVIK